MIDNNFFKTVQILDGGMGQQLLSKGLESKGSLWSTTALLDEQYHALVVNTHLDFIQAGANVIVTNNFSSRRTRMIENKVNDQFEYSNKKAGELAVKAKKISKKNIMIAGSLPAQNDTYIEDKRDKKIIKQSFKDQAFCLKSYIDFFYLDVLSSLRECKIALDVTSELNLPTLVGLHIKSNGKLPSGENLKEVVRECKNYNILGVILSCVSPEIIEESSQELSKLNVFFGFKANLWKEKEPLPHTAWIKKPDEIGTNPTAVLGSREDFSDEMFYSFSKKMIERGATIIGGCCEVKPKHIKKISELKNYNFKV